MIVYNCEEAPGLSPRVRQAEILPAKSRLRRKFGMNNRESHISAETQSVSLRDCILLVIIFAVALLSASCKKEHAEDRVIATINGEQALESEFKLFQKVYALKSGDGTSGSVSKTELLNRFIERKIVLVEAKKRNISATEAEVSAAYKDFDAGDSGSGFPEVLKRLGISQKDWKQYAADQSVFEKTLSAFAEGVSPGDDEIKAYFGAHLKEFSRGEQVHAYQIVSDNAEAAENIRKDLESGADFEKIAKARSNSPDRENGGDLGFVSPDDLPPEMSQAVFRTEPGKLSRVIKSDYGFHVFLVKEKRKKGVASLEEVKPLIEDRIRRSKAEKILASRLKELGGSTNVKLNKIYLEEIK